MLNNYNIMKVNYITVQIFRVYLLFVGTVGVLRMCSACPYLSSTEGSDNATDV